MLKKILMACLSSVAVVTFAGNSPVVVSSQAAASSIDFGPQLSLLTPCPSGNPGEMSLDTYAGRFLGWLVCNNNTSAKTAVTALLTYCVAYTLYQTAKGVGSTVWTWWKGEQLSPLMQRQVEVYMAELIKRNGMGQMAIRRSPHHEGDTCTCGDCCEARRVRT
jgi:hypothetical protein